MLGDEVLTPDSSRYWPADGYEAGPPAAELRQAVRARLGDRERLGRTPPAPAIPDDVVAGTRARYVEAYERIAGEPFEAWLERTGAAGERVQGARADPPEGGHPRSAGRRRSSGRCPRSASTGVEHVHVGPPDRARRRRPGRSSSEMCEKLLANPLIEDYEVELLDGGRA